MSHKQMESLGQFIKRKAGTCASILYRDLVFPFVKIGIERKTGSILCKGSYLREGCILDGHNYICEKAELSNVHLGYSSMVGRGAVISNTSIGKYTCVSNMETYIGLHPVKGENIAIYPSFFSDSKQFGYTYVNESSFTEAKYIDKATRTQIMVGNDVWFGYGVKVLEGITIGDGAVVGANSLVTKDIEPYAIYAGVPAKKIGQRFSDEDIAKLLELKWWDKGEEWIKANANDFKNPGEFILKNCK